MNWRLGIYLLVFSFGLFSCTKEPEEEQFSLKLPAHFPEPVYNLESNPFTVHGVELGRRLFYDPALSRDGTISCGDCHQLAAGFAHAEHDVSHGIDGLLGTRNSQHLVNMIWQKTFFWDGGVPQMDLIAPSPITNPVEMDNTMPKVMETLKASSMYQEAFRKAFPNSTDAVSSANFFKALSQFMGTLISADTKYDKYVTGQTEALSPLAKQGFEIFKAKCNSCHTAPLFTDNSFRSNGLPGIKDEGRKAVTLNPDDAFKFKVPSLRNIFRTGPYMHDGRFDSLEEVINYYSDGVADLPHTDPLLIQNGTPGFKFSKEEKAALVEFLKHLTDDKFLNNRNFDVP